MINLNGDLEEIKNDVTEEIVPQLNRNFINADKNARAEA